MKKRYLLMAKDYTLLADIEKQDRTLHPTTVTENAKDIRAPTMTSTFPAPWRIVEMPTGFSVEDATGQQLGVFYGRSDPNMAGHTGFLTIDEARQMAVNFARLPELLKRTSARSRFVKAKCQRETASHTRAQTQDRRQTPGQIDRLSENVALHPTILETHSATDIIGPMTSLEESPT